MSDKRHTHASSELEAAANLWIAVMEIAIKDAGYPEIANIDRLPEKRRKRAIQLNEQRSSAIRWIASKEFNRVCGMLDIDPDFIRTTTKVPKAA